MANQVTLTFAGEDASLNQSFDRVGGAARQMGDRVGESAGGFDRAGEAADGAEGKAQGFSDTLTGVADIGAGTGEILKGNLFEGFVAVGQGAADLAGGLASFVIPAIQNSRIAVLAKAAADKVAAGAARVWAGAQWLMNASLWASPITWIVVGIIALVAVIVLIATKTDWFQKAWRASWAWIKSAAASTWEFIKKIPGWIGTAFAKIAGFISTPYRKAFNLIADAWNATIGKLSWTVPSWIPGIGGNTIRVPNLPHFHAGVGRVPGAPGQETLAVLQAGETIGSAAGGGGATRLELASDGSRLADLLVEVLKRAVEVRGGNVQVVLGAKG